MQYIHSYQTLCMNTTAIPCLVLFAVIVQLPNQLQYNMAMESSMNPRIRPGRRLNVCLYMCLCIINGRLRKYTFIVIREVHIYVWYFRRYSVFSRSLSMLVCFVLAFVGTIVRFYSVTSNNKYWCKPHQNTSTYIGTPNYIGIMGRNTKISFIILMWHS